MEHRLRILCAINTCDVVAGLQDLLWRSAAAALSVPCPHGAARGHAIDAQATCWALAAALWQAGNEPQLCARCHPDGEREDEGVGTALRLRSRAWLDLRRVDGV